MAFRARRQCAALDWCRQLATLPPATSHPTPITGGEGLVTTCPRPRPCPTGPEPSPVPLPVPVQSRAPSQSFQNPGSTRRAGKHTYNSLQPVMTNNERRSDQRRTGDAPATNRRRTRGYYGAVETSVPRRDQRHSRHNRRPATTVRAVCEAPDSMSFLCGVF